MQHLGGEHVLVTRGADGSRAAVEPFVAEGGELHPAAGLLAGGAEPQGTAAAREPEDGADGGVEGDRIGPGAGQVELHAAQLASCDRARAVPLRDPLVRGRGRIGG